MRDIIDKSITLKQFLKKEGIRLNSLKTVKYETIRNVLRGSHDGKKYNDRYKGRLPYFPTDRTVTKLSHDLNVSEDSILIMIKNQYNSNKK